MKILECSDTVIKIEIDTIGRPNHSPYGDTRDVLIFSACPNRLSAAFDLALHSDFGYSKHPCIRFVQNSGLHTYLLSKEEYITVSSFLKGYDVKQESDEEICHKVINPIMELEV